MKCTSSTGQSNDLITNLCAALVKSNDFEKCNKLITKYGFYKDTFELTYNTACAYLESRDYANEEKYLESAQVAPNEKPKTKL